MIVHFSESRGRAFHGWLVSRHTFSFANYYDPDRMGFGALRVINDDSVEASMGFDTHPHRDMEIITIPLEGALKHEDSTGGSGIIKKGEVQVMSAGTGIRHSEYNASNSEIVKLLQIWVLPNEMGVKPRYEQKSFLHEGRLNKTQTIVSPDGRDGSLSIHQDAFFSLVDLDSDKEISYKKNRESNGVYVFIITGKVGLEGQIFNARDGIGIEDLETVTMKALENSEVLLMEVPL